MSDSVKKGPLRVIELYCLDFQDMTVSPTVLLGANERIVSVELGSRLPLRVWIEKGDRMTFWLLSHVSRHQAIYLVIVCPLLLAWFGFLLWVTRTGRRF